MITVVYITKEAFTKGEFLEEFDESLRLYWSEHIIDGSPDDVTFDDWINATPLEDLFNIVIDDSNEGIAQIFEG